MTLSCGDAAEDFRPEMKIRLVTCTAIASLGRLIAPRGLLWTCTMSLTVARYGHSNHPGESDMRYSPQKRALARRVRELFNELPTAFAPRTVELALIKEEFDNAAAKASASVGPIPVEADR